MYLNDTYLKEKLKHVYWLTGGPCSGKTTMTKALYQSYGFKQLDLLFSVYRDYFDDPKYDPMKIPYSGMDWEWYFNRPLDEYIEWMLVTCRRVLDFFLIDLLAESSDKPIVIDCGVEVEYLLPFIQKEHIIGFFTSDEEITKKYLHRDDHNMIWVCINKNVEDKDAAINNVNNAMIGYSNAVKKSCESYGIKQIIRTPDLSVKEQLEQVVKYFKL